MSKLRNPRIAGVFFRAGFVETWGRGYEKIRVAMDDANLQMPSFEYEANSVCVTIRREQFVQNIGESSQKAARKRPEKWPEKWPETKQIIISVIEANPTATISLLEQQTGKGHTTVKKYIKQLQEEGLLTRIGPDKGGYWKVNNKVN